MSARSAVAGPTAWAGSLLAAALYLAPQGWAGARDLPGMSFWSLPFAGIVAGATRVLDAGARRRGLLWTYGIAVVMGPALGLACFAVAATVRGGWVVAFPVFSCWAFGGLIGLVAGALRARSQSWPAAAGVSIAALAALLWIHSVLRGLG